MLIADDGRMRIAIVGCGYVADYYFRTLPLHPELAVAGICDRQPGRMANLAANYTVGRHYADVAEVCGDPTVQLVVNLTNPKDHYNVSLAALQAGQHVYSEKPLAMEMGQARELAALAHEKGLQLASAPCSLLGETAQTVWKALREQRVGRVRLVYAEMDDGLVHKMPYTKWLSMTGTPWPYQDEFEVGCTLEHAGYYTTWLTAFFGPAVSVTSFAAPLIPDKGVPVGAVSPDFSVACITFSSGVVARLTCGIVGTHDHSLQIFGDDGTLEVPDAWFYGSPVRIRKSLNVFRKRLEGKLVRKVPLVRLPTKFDYRGAQQMDFARGIAEVAGAIREGRPSRLSTDFSLHNNELVLAISDARLMAMPYQMTTTFAPIEPMSWAQ